MKREFETRYWIDTRRKKPMVRGFPKTENGSAEGVRRIIMSGYASKVQCVDRKHDKILWTAKAIKVPGLHVRSVLFEKGDT